MTIKIIKIILAVFVGWFIFALTGCALLPLVPDTSSTPVTTSEPYTEEPYTEDPFTEPPAEAQPTEESYVPRRSDWSLRVKVLDKTTFSDGETWWEVRITPKYAGSDLANLPDQGTVEITYKIANNTDGDLVGTVSVTLEDQSAMTSEEFVTTRSSKSKIVAIVTEVEYLN